MRRQCCQRKWEERIVRETVHTSRTTKSNTQTIMGSHEIQSYNHARETESNLQAWNSGPNASGSRTWPKYVIEPICWSQCRRHPQRRDLQGRTVHAKNRRTSPTTCDYNFFKTTHLWTTFWWEAVKKIHEAGNCELHEIRRRTDKVQCQRCQSYIKAGFQVCPCGGHLNMSEEMLSSIGQTSKQLIADACMTFEGTRGARHGVQPWQKHHFLAKDPQKGNLYVDSWPLHKRWSISCKRAPT